MLSHCSSGIKKQQEKNKLISPSAGERCNLISILVKTPEQLLQYYSKQCSPRDQLTHQWISHTSIVANQQHAFSLYQKWYFIYWLTFITVTQPNTLYFHLLANELWAIDALELLRIRLFHRRCFFLMVYGSDSVSPRNYNKVALPLSVIPYVLSLLIWPSGSVTYVIYGSVC